LTLAGLFSVVLLGALGGTAEAMPHDSLACDADQLTVTVVPGEPGAGQRSAQLSYLAKPGQSCQLSGPAAVTFIQAPGLTIVRENPPSFPLVTVSPGHPAHELVSWTVVPGPTGPVTPGALVIQTVGPKGDTVNLPWTFGAVGTGPNSPVRVGVVLPGPPSRS
jgi:hypothetical protein